MKRKAAKDRLMRAVRGRRLEPPRPPPSGGGAAGTSRKLLGHYAYYGITGNHRALVRF